MTFSASMARRGWVLAAALALVLAAAATGARAAEIPAADGFKHKLSLPVFNSMWNAAKRTRVMSNERLSNDMGGDVKKGNYRNTCVVRLSEAWNKAAEAHPKTWAKIPEYTATTYKRDQSLWENGGAAEKGSKYGRVYAVHDEAKNRVALRVKEIHDWFAAMWGPPTSTDKEAIRGDAGTPGIIIFLNCKWGETLATGHADLYFNGQCSSKCYFDTCSTVKLYAATAPVPCSVPNGDGASISGMCMDQDKCVAKDAARQGQYWPVVTRNECAGMGSRVKCCVAASDFGDA